MPKIIRVRSGKNEPLRYSFFCPGCKCEHCFNDLWEFNHDFLFPTISPSILVNGILGFPGKRCHSFITAGKIKFLPDCEHELAGKEVDLPEFYK